MSDVGIPLVENNELDGEGGDLFLSGNVNIQELLGTDPEIDTIILGCTHYPLLRPLIRFVPSRVKIIGQGQIVAGSLAELYLKRHPEIDRRLGQGQQAKLFNH